MLTTEVFFCCGLEADVKRAPRCGEQSTVKQISVKSNHGFLISIKNYGQNLEFLYGLIVIFDRKTDDVKEE